MATIIEGDIATAATLGINADQIVTSMKDVIFMLEASKTPLTLLANEVTSSVEDNPKIEWLEDERTPDVDRINAGNLGSGDTTLTVDNSNYFTVNSTFRVQRTGEVILVTAIPGATTLTVTRGWGGTSGANLLDNDSLTIMGGTAKEGAAIETSRATKTASKYNYTEIIRDPFGVTRTAMGTRMYGGNPLSHLQKARGIEHAVKMELKAWFQERALDVSGDEPRRSMGGIDELISTTRKTFGGHLTLVELFDWAEDAFRYGSDTKTLFLAPGPTSNVALLAAGRLTTVPSTETYGINVKELLTPHGRWLLIKHNLFTGDTYGTRGYSIDLANIGWAWFVDAQAVLSTNLQVGGTDKRKDEYLSECSLFRMVEKSHAAGLTMA